MMSGEAKKLKLATIHEIIPEEIFVMILKKLDFKSLTMVWDVCTSWRKVIELLAINVFSLKRSL